MVGQGHGKKVKSNAFSFSRYISLLVPGHVPAVLKIKFTI